MDALRRFVSEPITEDSIRSLSSLKAGIACNLILSDAPPQHLSIHETCYANAAILGNEYVYVFKGTHQGVSRYKIGKAKDISARRKIFSVKLPFDIELVAAFLVRDAYGLERELHRIHSDRRVGGEWFDLDAESFDEVCRAGIARELNDYSEAMIKTLDYSEKQSLMNDAEYIEHLESILAMNGIKFDRQRR
jgi:Meiotically up-regulated gene 113